jgi:hypothetical protein
MAGMRGGVSVIGRTPKVKIIVNRLLDVKMVAVITERNLKIYS